MTQESVSGQMGSSVLGKLVHPYREVLYIRIDISMVTDAQSCILIDTTRTG